MILKPAFRRIKQKSSLADTQKCLLIWDVFRAHRTEAVLQKLAEEGIVCVFVPANCTSELQPMDLSFNKPFKEHMKSKFTMWYSSQVVTHLQGGGSIDNIKLSLNMSRIKPLSTNWILSAADYLKNSPSIIVNGFTKARITVLPK